VNLSYHSDAIEGWLQEFGAAWAQFGDFSSDNHKFDDAKHEKLESLNCAFLVLDFRLK
jgi:hypothetical protein